MHVAVVKATFDEDARVWYVESSDIEGLHVGGHVRGVPPQRCGRRRRPPRRRWNWGSPHRDHRARLPPGSRSCVKNFGKPVRDRLFGAAHIFVCTSEPVVKRDKLSAERVG